MMVSNVSFGISILDWSIILGYIFGVMFLGSYLARRQKTSAHYFVADNKIPGWAAGISMFATMLSSFTFIAFPGWAFDRDWQILVRESMSPVVIIICVLSIIPLYRKAIKMSAYEYLETRFGYIGRLYGTIGFLIGHYFKVGVVLYAMSLALHSITGWPLLAVIITIGIVTLFYTFFGGIEGVVWTDVAQGLLMLFGGLLTIIFLVFVVTPGNIGQTISTAADAEKFRMFDFEFTTTGETFWVFAWVGIFHFLTKYSVDQTIVQRYLLAPSVKEAVKATYISIGCCFLAWFMFMFIGSLLWGFYSVFPERLADHITAGDQIFPYFIAHELPIGITGLILVGLFSATGSTISSDLNSIGACITSDFYNRFSENPNEKSRLLVGRITVLISGVMTIALASFISLYEGGIMELTLVVTAYVGAIIGGGLLGMFLLGTFTRRCNKAGLYVALSTGFLFTLWALLSQNPNIPLPVRYSIHVWYLPGLSNLLTIFVGYFASFFVGGKELAPYELTIYGHNLHLKKILKLDY